MNRSDEWRVSVDGGDWSEAFASRDDALASLASTSDDACVSIAHMVPYEPDVDEDALVERIIDQADSDVGSDAIDVWASDLAGVSREELKSLHDGILAVFNEWLEKTGCVPPIVAYPDDVEETTMHHLRVEKAKEISAQTRGTVSEGFRKAM